MLLRAFARLGALRSDVELLLAGDGPLRASLTAQSRDLGVADRVRFLGVREDVPDLLMAADVFALTSVSEAASLTLLEAMASCLPVVVTEVGGNPEIVENGKQGFLVPRGDDVAASAAVQRLLSDPVKARTMGEAGRDSVRKRYDLNQTIETYYQRYSSAADNLRRRYGSSSPQ